MARGYQLEAKRPECLRLVQITDVHLFDEPGGKLLGLDTDASFAAVMALALAEAVEPELILATGDLAQEPGPAAYGRLCAQLERFGKPVFWLPGNHDEARSMGGLLTAPCMRPEKQVLLGNWQILMLDSSVAGKVYGELDGDELAFLETCLRAEPERHALVVLHHQPVPIGSRWLDGIGLRNDQALFALLARHPQARLVLWGHVHQEFQGHKDGIDLLSTPSSCVQFKPGSEDFAAGPEAPGFRVLDLFPDGTWASAVRRIDPMAFTVDYSIKGY